MIRKHAPLTRRGVAMIVVVTMLALFAVVALGFVFYAESENTVSRYSREAQTSLVADVEPEQLASFFLGQLIYDTNDVYSAMRSHGLTTGVWGYGANNHIAFNGVGRGPAYSQALDYTQYTGARTVEAGLNIGRTYPNDDHVLGAVVDSSGKVLAASGSRGNTASKWLRPSASHHTAFPAAADSLTGCDVRNLEYGPGMLRSDGTMSQYDSMWMDLGFPVLVTSTGKKFKPLFAPLLMSLDGRLNLMVAGNRDPGTGKHRSHLGLSRHEINVEKVLSDNAAVGKLFRGASYSRYGSDGRPSGSYAALPAAPYYSAFDLEGDSTAPLTLPASGQNTIFPTFPTTYKSGDATELQDSSGNIIYPGAFSYSVKLGDDINRLPLSNMEPLLRYGGTNSGAFTSLFTQMLGSDWHTLDKRMRVTLLSNSLDRPSWMPMFPSSDTAVTYEMAAGDAYPKLKKRPQFQAGTTSSPPQRVNLNRPLTDYPAPDATTGVYKSSDMTQVNKACTERRELAKDIYERLCDATGALKAPGTIASTDPKYPQYLASRYLAQLAVNIVDYIDKDENITTFAWNPGKADDFVYGTEMPKVVVNEFYASLDNDKDDPDLAATVTNKKATYYHLRVWTELFNPTKDNVKLHRNGEAAYQLLIAKAAAGTALADDPLGAPKAADVLLTINDWDTPPDSTMPMNLKDKIQGGDKKIDNASGDYYYVVGPKGDFLPARDPSLPRTLISNKSLKKFDNDLATIHDQIPKEVDVFVQRLANPYLQANPDVADVNNGSKPYNPYITIDYVQKLSLKDANDKVLNDNREYDHTAILANPKELKDLISVGRRQPHRAIKIEEQQGIEPQPMDKPRHTLAKQNSKKLKDPMDNVDKLNKHDYDTAMGDQDHAAIQWLVHLDRPLVSLFELKHVSAQPPHQLTQKFFAGNTAFHHTAPWADPTPTVLRDSLLFRAFELFALPDRMLNNPLGGQVAGKININEVFDKETLRALLDAQPGSSSFTDADVDALFAAMQQFRDGGAAPTINSHLFMGFGVGVYDGAGPLAPTLDIASTFLNINGATATPGNASLLKSHPLPSATAPHPYFKDEMLAKLMHNVTFTSNTFALWVTAGFFEVTDDSVQPPRLGAEIGRADNRHIRHRFFAIIDRTETALLLATAKSTVSPGTDVKVYYTPQTTNGNTATITAGAMIDVGVVRADLPTPPANEVPEVLIVKTAGSDGSGSYFTADVKQTHATGAHIVWRGNPGPWPRYDPRKDTAVVPYFNIIE